MVGGAVLIANLEASAPSVLLVSYFDLVWRHPRRRSKVRFVSPSPAMESWAEAALNFAPTVQAGFLFMLV